MFLLDGADNTSFIQQLYRAKSLDEAFTLFDQKVQSLGFEATLFQFIPTLYTEAGLPTEDLMKTSDTTNSTFLKHYFEAKLYKVDYIDKALMSGRSTPIDWQSEAKQGQLVAEEKEFYHLIQQDYAMGNGITFPMMNDKRGVAAVSMACTEGDALYHLLIKEKYAELVMYAQLFYAYIMSSPLLYHHFLLPILDRLTETEKRLLPFIAEGKPLKTINLQPAISEKYADKLLGSIRRKFGNISKGRLMYYIGVLHILDML